VEDAIIQLGKALIEAFKNSPATLALMVVIVLLFTIIFRFIKILRELMDGSVRDSERFGKMLTLLDILVNSRRNGA
jgi:hypothetical protein